MEGMQFYPIEDIRIGKAISGGGYGEVYPATIKSLGKRVAVKVFGYKFDAFRELSFLQRLRGHPCIVEPIGFSCDEDNFYIIMELGDFAVSVATDSEKHYAILPLQVRRRLLACVALGLKVMHDRNIIHGDIKPANLICYKVEDGNTCVKICDFGISINYNPFSPFDPERVSACTSGYKAPEIMLKLPFDFKADIWSLGCIMFEFLNGEQYIPTYDKEGKFPCDVLSVGGRYKINRGKMDCYKRPDFFGLHALLSRIGPTERDNFCRKYSVKLKRKFDDCTIPQWSSKYPMNAEDSNADEKNLLWKMLTIDPGKRIDIDQVLMHRYFTPIRSMIYSVLTCSPEKLLPPKYDYEIENNISEEFLRFLYDKVWLNHGDYFNMARVILYTCSVMIIYFKHHNSSLNNHERLIGMISSFCLGVMNFFCVLDSYCSVEKIIIELSDGEIEEPIEDVCEEVYNCMVEIIKLLPGNIYICSVFDALSEYSGILGREDVSDLLFMASKDIRTSEESYQRIIASFKGQIDKREKGQIIDQLRRELSVDRGGDNALHIEEVRPYIDNTKMLTDRLSVISSCNIRRI